MTVAQARLKTSAIRLQKIGYHQLNWIRTPQIPKYLPVLLEYTCPGGKVMNRSQSSLIAFISEANQVDPVEYSAVKGRKKT